MSLRLLLVLLLPLCLSLVGCQTQARPAPLDLATGLPGDWLDPVTGWAYTFRADGSYSGAAPPLADGVERIAGQYALDDEGYLELSLAHLAPRRSFTFYERYNVWQVIELSADHALLACGREQVRLQRREVQP